MNRMERGMKYAIEAADLVTHTRYKVGAALFIGNKLISLGWNVNKTHPEQQSVFRWQHAEMAALVGIHKHDLTRAHIYVARVTMTGLLRIAKPCDDCQRILRAAGIRRAYYTSRDGSVESMRL